MDSLKFFRNKRVCITGAAGTVGRGLVHRLLEYPVAEVRALDNNESALFFIAEMYKGEARFHEFLADVRDEPKMRQMFEGVDFIFHTAAFKHVPLCERSPFDAVQTNIIGVQNVINSAIANKVRKVIFTSSDKAVNPTNVMGTSKLMGERLMTAANALRNKDVAPSFASVRFGNVAGSRGSVIPLFHQQISSGGPVTLTSREMTRFIMTLDEAVRLITETIVLSKGGEVFITKMPVLRVIDLAEVMIELLAPLYGYQANRMRIKKVGPRSGEKFYEELMNEEEIRRAFDAGKFFVVLPAFRNIYSKLDYSYKNLTFKQVKHAYNSANYAYMSKKEIADFLIRSKVFPADIQDQLQKMKLK